MADAVDELRASLRADRVVLLGHSYGGFVSLTYALRHAAHLTALVLVDTAASYGFRAESLDVARRRGTPEMLAALDRLWNDELTTDAEFQRDWETIAPLYFHGPPVASSTSYRLQTRKAVLPTFRDYDLRPRLSEIRVPTLVTVGRHDWITSVCQAQELSGGLPNAELVVFYNSGHLPFIEEPERFQQLVQRFVEQ